MRNTLREKLLALLIALSLHSYVHQQVRAEERCQSFEVVRKTAKPLRSNWRLDGFLYKPVAEHYDGALVALLPRKTYGSVTLKSFDGKRRGRFPMRFRSTGDVGDVFTSYDTNGREWRKKLGAILIEVRGFNRRVRQFVVPCAGRRSDGK